MPHLRLLHFVIVKNPSLLPMHFKVSELAATPFKKLDISQLELYNVKNKIFNNNFCILLIGNHVLM